MSTRARSAVAAGMFPRAVLIGGLVAGSLDLAYACTAWALRGVPPVRILQAIASGWIGREASVAGEWTTAWLGVASHFGIALAMAWTYYAIARAGSRGLVRHPWQFGMAYGLLLYGVMTYLVVPLSAAGDGTWPAWRWNHLLEVAAHMLLVGVPCALAARHAMRAGRGA